MTEDKRRYPKIGETIRVKTVRGWELARVIRYTVDGCLVEVEPGIRMEIPKECIQLIGPQPGMIIHIDSETYSFMKNIYKGIGEPYGHSVEAVLAWILDQWSAMTDDYIMGLTLPDGTAVINQKGR